MQFSLRIVCVVGAVALISSCASTDGTPALATKYGKAAFIGTGGYKDKMLSADTWEVSASANGMARQGFAGDMAIYRAAEIAKQKGFVFLQVVKQEGSTRMIGVGSPNSYAGQDMELKIKGAAKLDDPMACEMKNAVHCTTLNVEEVMTRLAPSLNIASK
jgi:hypothetical protein